MAMHAQSARHRARRARRRAQDAARDAATREVARYAAQAAGAARRLLLLDLLDVFVAPSPRRDAWRTRVERELAALCRAREGGE